jgi:site-specific recombinase XerD
MVKDIKKLVKLCEEELTNREYSFNLHKKISKTWDELVKWMHESKIKYFDECTGFKYCDEKIGTHIFTELKENNDKVKMRAIRMLISYQKEGDFEFRIPAELHFFEGISGEYIKQYLSHLRNSVKLSEKTISNKRHYLYAFNKYLEKHRFKIENLTMKVIEKFYSLQKYSLSLKHNCNSTIRLFLRYSFDNGITNKDYSIFILPDKYRNYCKLPSTYKEEEIKRIIGAVNRASAIGKRDYLILLLAAEYGWRSSDIVNFTFNQIDWDKNIISLNQQKTNTQAIFPLLSSIGNAIIEYLKNGRPETDSKEIIVSLETSKRGKKLSPPTIHSIVTKYMRMANISNLNQKKHGPHSLRHSLATNMLKKNISIPIISTVLGHQNTDSTNTYISVDINSLKQCALNIPEINTELYGEE